MDGSMYCIACVFTFTTFLRFLASLVAHIILIIQEQHVTTVSENYETTCWGCGLRLSLPTCTSVFKCGWCGALTNPNKQKNVTKGCWWRRLWERCIVSFVFVFMLFIIFGAVWAVLPIVFSFSFFSGIFHSTISAILSIATISFFSLVAFHGAGSPPNILWGSYPTVGRNELENYTFCYYCSKPKSPRTHHCRTCGKCILDMDHHCPFIGNCVGADNHRCFIAFLISALAGTSYASIMSIYAMSHIWQMPSLTYSFENLDGPIGLFPQSRRIVEIMITALSSLLFQSSRGVILVYIIIASVSVQIGLSILLCQQLYYIYEGETYLGHLNLQAHSIEAKKDCQNLVRFFGFPYSVKRFLPNSLLPQKIHVK
ncbi:hypothetical protein AHAS_Ahas13G0091100 [Arachis hypogaea]